MTVDWTAFFKNLLHPSTTGHNWLGPGNSVPAVPADVVDIADAIARDHDYEYEAITKSDLSPEEFNKAVADADNRAVSKFVNSLKEEGFDIWNLVGATALNFKVAADHIAVALIGRPLYPLRYVTFK